MEIDKKLVDEIDSFLKEQGIHIPHLYPGNNKRYDIRVLIHDFIKQKTDTVKLPTSEEVNSIAGATPQEGLPQWDKTALKFVETGIRKGFEGWQAWFTIGVQTFFLMPVDDDTEEQRIKHARWYQSCLNTALNNLIDLKY